jgi:putative flavoprotein involved in K+ transport
MSEPPRTDLDGSHHPVVVVGGGQAGLSTSYCLTPAADDVAQLHDNADALVEGIKDSIDACIEAVGLDAPGAGQSEVDLGAARVTSVVWSAGFGRERRWVEEPERGVAGCPGLYFIGLPWRYTWGTGRFRGSAGDAEYLAINIVSSGRAGTGEVHWIAGTPDSTLPSDEYWTAPRAVA